MPPGLTRTTAPAGAAAPAAWAAQRLLKAIVIKAEKKLTKAANREEWKVAQKRALATIMDEKNITSPRKGALSVYGTNVLTNITNNMGGLPTRNSQQTSFEDRAEKTGGE